MNSSSTRHRALGNRSLLTQIDSACHDGIDDRKHLGCRLVSTLILGQIRRLLIQRDPGERIALRRKLRKHRLLRSAVSRRACCSGAYLPKECGEEARCRLATDDIRGREMSQPQGVSVAPRPLTGCSSSNRLRLGRRHLDRRGSTTCSRCKTKQRLTGISASVEPLRILEVHLSSNDVSQIVERGCEDRQILISRLQNPAQRAASESSSHILTAHSCKDVRRSGDLRRAHRISLITADQQGAVTGRKSYPILLCRYLIQSNILGQLRDGQLSLIFQNASILTRAQ